MRPPYNVNVLTQAAARSLRHIEVFNRQAAELCEERGRLAAGLARHAAIEAFPSEANFITIRVPDAPALYQHFKASGILIKQLHGDHPLLAQCLRLTVGAPQENDAMLAALDAYFA